MNAADAFTALLKYELETLRVGSTTYARGISHAEVHAAPMALRNSF
jgi:hypothetical protein